MAKQGNRFNIRLKSTESAHVYVSQKNKINHPDRIEIMKYDPTLRKRVLYREEK